jgi:predicted nucleic acid-binding protein
MKSTPNAFVDTNVLVYAADERNPLDRKTVIARELMLGRHLHLSAQVLNEFVAAARHPQKLNLSQEGEREWLAEWLRLPIAPLTVELFSLALELHARYQISHGDALIVATALETGCETLYSEDLNDGQDYDGVKVVNPFR